MEARSDKPVVLKGRRNLLCLAGILVAAFLPPPHREAAMIASAVISLKVTPKSYHEANGFNFYPILEVAILFLGIFITMGPALEILYLRGGELGLGSPRQFFWATGLFSSLLDNAPTYLTFVTLAQGLGLAGPHVNVPEGILAAISTGAVFFGAATYIGNAPNLMVQSIAAHKGWKMPSFFGYLLWSGAVLVPLFFIIDRVFFR